ncbi:MAG: hypothetical protein DRH04_00545 [Deltaproteobacteria bacterium]|nr:MAG: hypothetical protein DRH04_00545 [Deltaproteobacteria bacterium]
MKTRRILVFFLIFFHGMAGMVSAAPPPVSEASMVARGSAVVTKDLATAKRQAIADTLNNALDLYIHDQMVAGHDHDDLISERILSNQDRYILSYEIISDRLLGDLLQLELNVHFNKTLLQDDLAMILKPEKKAISDISLIIVQENINEELLYDPLLARPLLLQPEKLAAELKDELTAYGFTLTLHQDVDAAAQALLAAIVTGENDAEESSNVDFDQLRGMVPGDLLLYLEVRNFQEEKIYTVQKQLLSIEDTVTFIDMKNETCSTLPVETCKLLTDDVPAGMNSLAAKLALSLKDRIMNHILQKYAVFPEHEQEFAVVIHGFRSHQDYVEFKTALAGLRTIKAVDLSSLARGRIELKVTTYAQIEPLLEWINRFVPDGNHFQLRAGLATEAADVILVKVDYAETAH